MLRSVAVAIVVTDDEMVEAWFSSHRGALNELSEQALADVAP